MNISPNINTGQVRSEILEQAGTLLKCETVDAGDHFLDIGGDSLVAPVLARRIEARFGVRPQLEDIFTMSFGELADHVAASLSGAGSSS